VSHHRRIGTMTTNPPSDLQKLIQHLVAAPGAFGATRDLDWTLKNAGSTFMKTCGGVRLIWDQSRILVTDTVGSDEARTRNGFIGSLCMEATREVYGHLGWWRDAMKELEVQRREARQADVLAQLTRLL